MRSLHFGKTETEFVIIKPMRDANHAMHYMVGAHATTPRLIRLLQGLF